MIKPYLSDIIGKWRNHSGNKIIEHKTHTEWEIQLTMAINFISCKGSDEIRTKHTKVIM